MNHEHNRPRILFLDGLRCVAILAVVLFHYFSRWTPPIHYENLYPYGNAFLPLFKYGFYGVQLFFVVSGFVITLTLFRCSGPLEFGVRRFARLWPSMALCSVMTLLFIHIVPNHSFHVSPLGLIPSLTFIDPALLNRVFRTKTLDWIDGAYWSLWVEVRFYFLAAFIFFCRRNKFSRNMCLLGSVVLAASFLASFFHRWWLYYLNLFFVADYLPWFLIGIAFYLLENGIEKRLRAGLFLVGFLTLVARAACVRLRVDLEMAFIIPLLFLAASRISVVRRILSQRWLTGVGAASYSLYLLHQNLGIALIGWLGAFLNFSGRPSAVLAILTGLIAVVIAQLIYTYWESPLNQLIVGRVRAKPSACAHGIGIPGEKASGMAAGN